MANDSDRTREDYDRMGDAYADDSDTDPVKVGYERPAMLAMSGDVRGKRVLDVGCAAGALSRALVARGANVVGLDLNETLIECARGRSSGEVQFHVADISQPMPFLESESFDLVTASLMLHYLDDWSTPLREFRRVLKQDGALLVSTHHPMQDVNISNPPTPYFEKRVLTDIWHKGGRDFEVRFHRRPLSAIVDALADAGFVIERMPEPRPDPAAFADEPELYARLAEGPFFLFIRARPGPH
jgi:ubiquinone/menaquinone biosynthesis C-methylase UbiE